MLWRTGVCQEMGKMGRLHFSHYMRLASDGWSSFKPLQYGLCGCTWFPTATASCGHPMDFYALLTKACIATI